MNLTDKYPANKSNKYFFQKSAVKDRNYCFIDVCEWSEANQRFIYQDNLNQNIYVTMLDDPSYSILGYLDESAKTDRNLSFVLQKNHISYTKGVRDDYIFTEEDADKVIRLLQGIFLMR